MAVRKRSVKKSDQRPNQPW